MRAIELLLPSRRPVPTIAWFFFTILVFGQSAMAPETASAQRLLDRIRARMQRPTPPSNTSNLDQAANDTDSEIDANGSRVLARPLDGSDSDDEQADADSRAALGLQVQELERGNLLGLLVDGFTADSFANRAGIRTGDVIVEIEGDAIRSRLDAANIMQARSPGELIEVRFVRDSRLYKTLLRLSTLTNNQPTGDPREAYATGRPPLTGPSFEPGSTSVSDAGASASRSGRNASLGLEVAELPNARGVLVTKAPVEKAGYFFGLRDQDRIVSVDGRIIRSSADLLREIRLRRPGQSVRLGLVRRNILLDQTVVLSGPDGMPPSDIVAQSIQDGSVADPADPNSNLPKESNGLMTGLGSVLGGFLNSSPSSTDNDEESTEAPGTRLSEPKTPSSSRSINSLELPPE